MPSLLGIDLGTTNSCAAAIRDGKPVVVPLQGEKLTMPSVVGLLEDKTTVGDRAKRLSVNQPEVTVFSAKRLIGSSFDDKHTQRAIAGLPYRVVKGESGDTRIKIRDKTYAIQEISALILGEIKRAAESHLGEQVSDAVITVPAYFNDRQRQATKDAGLIAGLNVLHVVNEPTAAALAYGFHQGAERKIAVYDLGGGTFDVSVLRAGGGAVEVLASSGDDFLGGHDFDGRVADWIESYIKEHHQVGVDKQVNSLQRLREAAEIAKIRLTTDEKTRIVLPFLATNTPGETIHVECELDRDTYISLVDDLVQRTLETFTETLAAAKLQPKEIDELLLVGGMTASPVVRHRISQFVGCEPATGVHPDLVVAVGAAYQAEILEGEKATSVLLDVTPHNLGLMSVANIAETVVPKNTQIPTEVTREFATVRDNQEVVRLVIFQGDSRNIDENQILGEFFLEGIRPAPRGDVRIDVRFGITADGNVTVTATDKETGKVQSIRVEGPTALSSEEIDDMISTHQETLQGTLIRP